MKAIELEGSGGQVAIDLEFSSWSARKHVLRTEGDSGITIYFGRATDPASWAAANARIAELEAGGEQAKIFKHDPTKVAAAIAEDTAKRKAGRPPNGK
jgi:hypothetical protein